MPDTDTLARALKKAPLFSTLPEGELAAICRMATVKDVGKGAMIFLSGEEARAFFVVIRGRIKVYKLSPAGKELILHVMEPGTSFAEAAMLMDGRYPAYATALTSATVARIPKEAFLAAVERTPRIALGMIASMATWLRRLNDLLEDVTLRDVDARLAGYLLAEARKQRGPASGPVVVRLDVDRSTLASRIGTVRETLSRSLRRLQDRGVLAVRGKKIKILDLEGLKRAVPGSGRDAP